MKGKLIVKLFSIALVAFLWLVTGCANVYAQCAMCKASAAASGASNSLNIAILVLLIPPVTIFCAIFIVAFRLRAAPAEAPRETPQEKRSYRARQEQSDTGAGSKERRSSEGSGLAEAT